MEVLPVSNNPRSKSFLEKRAHILVHDSRACSPLQRIYNTIQTPIIQIIIRLFRSRLAAVGLFLFMSPFLGIAQTRVQVASGRIADSLRRIEAQRLADSIQMNDSIDEVVVRASSMIGSKFEARNRTGSAYYLSPKEITLSGYSDINRMLKSVPGVNIYEEDGFGLRPNISLRGTKAERSERITLMEDGILAAPAPYAAPAAYYFPNAARMYAIEVLKGSSQVQYGPFTTGGAINMISTPIPQRLQAKLITSYGVYNTLKSHLMVGNSYQHVGFMVEYLRHQSKGFRHDIPDKRTGFQRNDLIAKVAVHTQEDADLRQRLEFKFGFANEDSDETYLGLSETDFATRPFYRYAGAQKDNLTTRHFQYAATHLLELPNKLKITTSLYYNYFFRNWYKLNEVRTGHTKAERRNITDILADPETNSLYFDVVTGARDYIGEALMLRANKRSYHSRGAQTKGEYRFDLGGGFFTTELGLRYHADLEDRFQHDDSYSMREGKMELFLAGLPGSSANRITTAHAFSSYLLTKWVKDIFTLTAGVRYENVRLVDRDYTTADSRRTGHLRVEIPNTAWGILPGFGINCKVLPILSAFAGVHKGFAPPSAVLGQKPENSWNMESGLRLGWRELRIEVIGFYNRYSNMLGSDLAAQGGQGTLDQFNIGKALVRGVESILQYQPLPYTWHVRLPLQLSYTFTDTQMLNNFTSNSWGTVVAGDEIPYIFRHALNAQIGLETKWVDATVSIRYNGDMRTTPGQGRIANRERIPAHYLLDASLRGRVHKNVTLTVNAINLLNRKYLVSRHPAGLRAGHPFGIYGGLQLTF